MSFSFDFCATGRAHSTMKRTGQVANQFTGMKGGKAKGEK